MTESKLSSKASIIFFMMDQLSAKWLEGESAQACPTPNIDGLCARGVVFSQAFSSNPLCMPSRSTIATGLSTRGHGVLTNGYQLDSSITTFMQLLQKAGWYTGAFGKVHLQPHFAGVYPDYHSYGFDITHITEDARAGEWLDWVQREYPQYYEAALATIWPSEIPELKRYGKDQVDLSTRIKKIQETFSWATKKFPNNSAETYTLPFPEPVSQTAWITRQAVDFIRNSNPAQPIYAHVSYVQPHGPSCPPAEYMKYIDVTKIPEPIPPEWIEDSNQPTCFKRSEGVITRIPDNWRELRRYYFADIVHLDHQLGLVMEVLEKTGRLENTYIIFIADHGELLMDHGFSGKAERHYDACIRVPLIITGPGLQKGLSCNEIVQHEDIFPTVLEIAGLPLPEPHIMGPYLKELPNVVAGRSLLKLCKGETLKDWRNAAYVESYNNINSATPVNWARTIRTKDWRYTMYPEKNGEQLFYLRDDPDEQRNLAYDPEYAQVRQELRDRLLELIILQDYPHTPRQLYALGVH